MDHDHNAAALAFVDAYYATPDDAPPGTWEALEALLAAHPLDFGTVPLSLEDGDDVEPSNAV